MSVVCFVGLPGQQTGHLRLRWQWHERTITNDTFYRTATRLSRFTSLI